MTEKVCVIVVHGVGDQVPFQMMDQFTANLLKAMNWLEDKRVVHHRHWIEEEDRFEDWVRIDFASGKSMEIYEYYWANLSECQVTLPEIMRWLIRTSDGARTYYSENIELIKRYEAFDGQGFKKRWYLKHLGWFLRIFAAVPRMAGFFIPLRLNNMLKLLVTKSGRMFIDAIGDVVMYTSSDLSSKYYATRQRILSGCVDKVKRLLLHGEYDKMVLVGHSMGSVIAFDALKKINNLMNSQPELREQNYRLHGLVTVGSPLDKVAFFFRERSKDDQFVRKQIIQAIHGFRTRGLFPGAHSANISTTLRDYLTHLNWLNFWDPKDPIAGHLDFYTPLENIYTDNGRDWGFAHMHYFTNDHFYKEMLNRLFPDLADQDVRKEKEAGVGEV